jgi:prophage regulatory protein
VATTKKTLLRRKRVEARTGHSRSTIYSKMAKGEFPQPVRIGIKAVAWIEEEIDDYIDARVAQGRGHR